MVSQPYDYEQEHEPDIHPPRPSVTGRVLLMVALAAQTWRITTLVCESGFSAGLLFWLVTLPATLWWLTAVTLYGPRR